MKSVVIALSLGLGLVACGHKNEPEYSGKADGQHLTEFQKSRLLGHYSTNDGGTGFIFDRTQSPYRAKLDGTNEVKTLTESGGPRDTKEYRSDDHKIWIRMDDKGNVLLFQGPKQHEGVDVVRDADADQLR